MIRAKHMHQAVSASDVRLKDEASRMRDKRDRASAKNSFSALSRVDTKGIRNACVARRGKRGEMRREKRCENESVFLVFYQHYDDDT